MRYKKRFLPVAMIMVMMCSGLMLINPSYADRDKADAISASYRMATFAGGCFWCVESDFDKVAGVVETVSGYMGGHVVNPGYKQVSAGGTGHAEVVRVTFDPRLVSYDELLTFYWHNIDPTVVDQQFCDKGRQYRSAIFYHDDEQKVAAEQSLRALERSKPFAGAVVTEILPATTFYAAEDYHQNYYSKNPLRYKYYRYSCGRDQRLGELWGH
jgi:peptide-methionine (S)-S-oxide reductase